MNGQKIINGKLYRAYLVPGIDQNRYLCSINKPSYCEWVEVKTKVEKKSLMKSILEKIGNIIDYLGS